MMGHRKTQGRAMPSTNRKARPARSHFRARSRFRVARISAGLTGQGGEPSPIPRQALTPCPLSQRLGEGVRPGGGGRFPPLPAFGRGRRGEGLFPRSTWFLAHLSQHLYALPAFAVPNRKDL